jgi:peptide/nickel transport system substrate-binding protein
MNNSTPCRAVSLIIVLFILVVLSACQPPSVEPETLVYGLTLSPSGIDPHLNASAELGIPLSSVYDTLVFYNQETDEFVPGLAESWMVSDDGLRYTFHLRDDVRFHDGTTFDAEAVRANFEYTLDPDHHSQKAASMLGPIESVHVPDEHTVVIQLEEPFAPLLNSLAQVYLGMASPTALDEWGSDEYQFHQVGTGPYKFIEYVPNGHIILEKNPDYAWAPEIYQREIASVERLEFRFYEDPATRSIALSSGAVDILGEVPAHDATRLTTTDDFTLYPIPIPGQPLHFFFNTDNSPTDDILVRQALIAAVDRENIIETVFRDQSPLAQGPLSSHHFNLNVEENKLVFDPDTAAQLLDEAGWRRETAGGIRSKDGAQLDLRIIAPQWGSNSETAQLIKADWETLGAKVHLNIAPGFGQLKEMQSEGDYHAIGLNFFGTDPDLLRAFYSSDGFYNWHGFLDDDLDRLLLEGAQISDIDSRHAIYAQIYKLIQENALILPIRDYVSLVVANEAVEGLHYAAEGWFPHLIDLALR